MTGMFVLAVDTSTPQVTAGLVRVAELPGADLATGRVAPIIEELGTWMPARTTKCSRR